MTYTVLELKQRYRETQQHLSGRKLADTIPGLFGGAFLFNKGLGTFHSVLHTQIGSQVHCKR